jgi:hypothetical protein
MGNSGIRIFETIILPAVFMDVKLGLSVSGIKGGT